MNWSCFLAPIHEYTDLPFRLLCQKYGAETACVPLVNTTALSHDSLKLSLLDAHTDEKEVGVQLVGNNAKAAGNACALIYEKMPFISWFNLNCGCHAQRTIGCGGGSALLSHPKKIADIVAAMKSNADIPVSVKIRIRNNIDDTLEVCREIVKAGAEFIIIHGRTPKQAYSGKADWEHIRKVKERLSLPIIGNGDLTMASDGRLKIEGGYCDGFMIGRAAMANPLLFSDRKPESMDERLSILKEYVSLHEKYLGEPKLRDVKMKAILFVSAIHGAAKVRNNISRAQTIEEVLSVFTE